MRKVSIRDRRTEFEGLWYHEDEHRYTSRYFNVNALRDYKGTVQLVMYKNKFHKKGDGRPSFQFSLMGRGGKRNRTRV